MGTKGRKWIEVTFDVIRIANVLTKSEIRSYMYIIQKNNWRSRWNEGLEATLQRTSRCSSDRERLTEVVLPLTMQQLLL